MNDAEHFPDAFGRDKSLLEIFLTLINKHKIKRIIETGTYKGKTSAALAIMMKNKGKVTTIETNPDTFKEGEWLNTFSNLERVWDTSFNWIKNHGNKLEKPTLFFLDAHWKIPTPTPLELDAIFFCKLKPIIVIHDFKVPNRPKLGFDRYSDWIYNMDYTKPYLDKIYGKDLYVCNYNLKADNGKRGALIVEPSPKSEAPITTSLTPVQKTINFNKSPNYNSKSIWD